MSDVAFQTRGSRPSPCQRYCDLWPRL